MIEAKQIRLGNVYNRKHGKGWTMMVIDEYLLGKIFSGDTLECSLNNFESIPLTPLILENCGFSQNNWSEGGVIIYEGWAKDDVLLSKDFKLDGHDFPSLKYLHQLQNLYYTFTGQELNYTP